MHPFPWREEESLHSGAVVLRPTVDVQVGSPPWSIVTKALIDTGAPRTVFPRGIGDFVGVQFPDLPRDADKKITLMGRNWPAVTTQVAVVLRPFDDLGWEAEADFVLDEGLPFALLGYEGFLNRWAVTFNAAYGYFLV